MGISRENKEKLFKDFSQVDSSTTRTYEGTGLGLSICKGLVELMDGEISVTSEEGKGSTFSFYVTVEEGQREEEVKGDIFMDNRNLEEQISKLSILTVDDNRTNQMVAEGILKKLGCKTDLASNGYDAIVAISQKKYDVVLLDCHMPFLDGYETTKKIIEKYGEKKPYIIACTASAMARNIEMCTSVGMDDFVSKPIVKKSLLEVLVRFIEQKASGPTQLASLNQDSESDPSEVSETKPSKTQLVNLDLLYEQFSGDEDILVAVIASFLDTMDAMLANIEASIVDQNFPELERNAHTFKGAVSNFFVTSAVEIAKQLENQGHSRDDKDLKRTFESLKGMGPKIKEELSRISKKGMVA